MSGFVRIFRFFASRRGSPRTPGKLFGSLPGVRVSSWASVAPKPSVSWIFLSVVSDVADAGFRLQRQSRWRLAFPCRGKRPRGALRGPCHDAPVRFRFQDNGACQGGGASAGAPGKEEGRRDATTRHGWSRTLQGSEKRAVPLFLGRFTVESRWEAQPGLGKAEAQSRLSSRPSGSLQGEVCLLRRRRSSGLRGN